ncbi:MAG: efflux transporter SaoE [Syntrophomonas sp.]
MSSLLVFIRDLLITSADYLNSASIWLLASYLLAGGLRNVLSPEGMQRQLGNTKPGSLVKATVSGMLLPICSCGVIPLGLGLYYSGAYLGPVLAFMAATPIINPAAVFLAFALLGPQIAVIYIIVGFTAPSVIGWLGNHLGGPELHAPAAVGEEAIFDLSSADQTGRWIDRLRDGFRYAYSDLGPTVSRYVIWGMLIAGLISTAVPASFIQKYLGNPGLISIGGIAVLGAVMYVCAVGHIPFVAALLATGASPGIAITFLMAGAATNLPELISIFKMIGPRTAVLYSSSMVVLSMIAGEITNMLLLPGFVPVLDPGRHQTALSWANRLVLESPDPVKWACSLAIGLLFCYSYWPQIKGWLYGQ